MIKNKLLIRCIFLASIVAVLGSAYALAKQTGLLSPVANKRLAETDPWKILQHLHQYYDRDSVICQTYNIRLFSEKDPSVFLEQYECTYYTGKGQVYSRLGAAETYCNKDMLINADLDSKVVSILPSQPDLLRTGMPALKEMKKKATAMQGQLSIIEENGADVLLYKNDLDPDVKSYRVYYDPFSWAINSVKMEVWKEDAFLQEKPEPLIMEIQFSPLKTLSDFPEKFGRSRFLQLKNDTLALRDEYLDFELVNQLNLSVK